MAEKDTDSIDINAILKDIQKIEKKSIVELKSIVAPSNMVKMVMNAVCLLMGRTPSWKESKKLLGDPNLLKNLQTFNKDDISPEVITKLRNDYISNPDFTPAFVKKVSSAACNLCSWVICY